jgi:hypothetical protein
MYVYRQHGMLVHTHTRTHAMHGTYGHISLQICRVAPKETTQKGTTGTMQRLC